MYGYIYKITNKLNGKVYIGQTTRTVEKRFQEHLTRAEYYCRRYGKAEYKYMHLYLAMVKDGKENFFVETIDIATSREELDDKEKYWIRQLRAVELGYNMLSGSSTANPMDSALVKAKHDKIMQTVEVRKRISKTLSETLRKNGRSEEYRKKISESQRDRQCFIKNGKRTYTAGANHEKINQLLADGWVCITKVKQNRAPKDSTKNANSKRVKELKAAKELRKSFATRSIPVYCILDTGERFDFESILDAGIWWYETFKPFGEIYSDSNYQRKIKASIKTNHIQSRLLIDNRYKTVYITNIQWFYKNT